jgi:16S rRNA (guanine527-N7)-methyltransferase
MQIDQLHQKLHEGLIALHLPQSQVMQDLLIRYIKLLVEWNDVYNLTAIRIPEEILTKHILDSLAVSSYLQGQTILDVGTGAGLPGILLAIIQPNKYFVLLDSNKKKTRFLHYVKQQLNLTNIEIFTNRVEAFTTATGFDNIVTRAYATLKDFVLTTQHLLKKGGHFLAMKGQYPESELNDIPQEFIVNRVYKLNIPFLAAQRHLVSIIKFEHQLESK